MYWVILTRVLDMIWNKEENLFKEALTLVLVYDLMGNKIFITIWDMKSE